MKPAAVIAILGGFYLAALLGKSSKDTMKANALRAQILDIDLDWQRIRLTINVQNPTSGNLVLRSVVGDLYINRTKVANMYMSGYVNIPSNGQNYFNIEGQYIQQNMGKIIAQMMQGKQRYEVMFRGTINVNNEMIPFDFTTTMNA